MCFKSILVVSPSSQCPSISSPIKVSPSPRRRLGYLSRQCPSQPHSPLPPHKRPEYSVSSSTDHSPSHSASYTPSPHGRSKVADREEADESSSSQEWDSASSASGSSSPSPSPRVQRSSVMAGGKVQRSQSPIVSKKAQKPRTSSSSHSLSPSVTPSPPSQPNPLSTAGRSQGKSRKSSRKTSTPPQRVQRSQRSRSLEKPCKRQASVSSSSSSSPSSPPFSPPPWKLLKQDKVGKKLGKPVPAPTRETEKSKTRGAGVCTGSVCDIAVCVVHPGGRGHDDSHANSGEGRRKRWGQEWKCSVCVCVCVRVCVLVCVPPPQAQKVLCQ